MHHFFALVAQLVEQTSLKHASALVKDRKPGYRSGRWFESNQGHQFFQSECSSTWLERVLWEHEVAGSNPVTPTTFPWGILAVYSTDSVSKQREPAESHASVPQG